MFTIEIPSAGTRFSCAPGDTLLQAALRSGVGLPYECNSGGCGTCKFELIDGDVSDAWPDAPGRSASDRLRGRRLACQSIPRADCTIKVRPGAEYVSPTPPEVTGLSLMRSREIARDLRELTFVADSPARFQAGQFAMLQLNGLRRAYSMSSTATEHGYWQFVIRRTDGGRMSADLFGLQEGARVLMDGPYGLAHYRAQSQRDLVCIGGGSGLAPLLSILKAAHVVPRRPSWLFYGARTAAHLPDVVHLLGAHVAPAVRYRPVISMQPTATAPQVAEGLVHEHLMAALTSPAHEHDFYLAGPPPMIESCLRLLVVDHGVPQSQVIYDRFF